MSPLTRRASFVARITPFAGGDERIIPGNFPLAVLLFLSSTTVSSRLEILCWLAKKQSGPNCVVQKKRHGLDVALARRNESDSGLYSSSPRTSGGWMVARRRHSSRGSRAAQHPWQHGGRVRCTTLQQTRRNSSDGSLPSPCGCPAAAGQQRRAVSVPPAAVRLAGRAGSSSGLRPAQLTWRPLPWGFSR